MACAIAAGCGDREAETSNNAAPEPVAGGAGTTAIDGVLPASAAGTSTASGPGVPADFTGTIRESMPISAQEQQEIDAANALQAARNPVKQDPVDRGFATPSIDPSRSIAEVLP